MKSLFAEINIVSIIEAVEMTIERALQLEEGRTGGYFCLADPDTGSPIAILQIGDLPDLEKAGRYLTNAIEKARRLAENKEHRLASQSASTELGRYSGAVKTPTAIYSFSGLPELLDEAAMLLAATFDCALEREEADSLAQQSKNIRYPELKSHLLSS